MEVLNKLVVLFQENLQYLDIRSQTASNIMILELLLLAAVAVAFFTAAYKVAKSIAIKEADGKRVYDYESALAVILTAAGVLWAISAFTGFDSLVELIGLGKFYFILK